MDGKNECHITLEENAIFLRDNYRDLYGLEFVECLGLQAVKKKSWEMTSISSLECGMS